MKLTPNSTAPRRKAIAAARSFGGPQIPSPVRRIAPKPRRLTVSSLPSSIVPAVAADRLVAFLVLSFTVHSPSMHLFRGAPTGIARLYTWGDRRRVRPQILFVNNIILGDYESLDPRRPVLRGICHQSQAGFLIADGDIAASRGRRVSIHESKVVSVEWRGVIAAGICQTGGYEALGELGNRVVASWLCVLVLLCDRKFLADFNRYGLIFSNSSEQHFLRSGFGIEVPCAVL